MLEVPFYCSSLVNNSMLVCLLGSISSLQTTNIPAPKMPVRIHCKAFSTAARLALEARSKCQDFVARFKDDGLPDTVDRPFL